MSLCHLIKHEFYGKVGLRKKVMTMVEADFARQREEDLQRLRGFRLMDDDFMAKVFEDK